MSLLFVNANSLHISLADGSVQCAVTSPPYWGLRDYNVDGQLGLESTPDLYVEHMVQVFREVRRVLRDDGTLWLNLGDSYGTGTRATRAPGSLDLGKNTNNARDNVPRHGAAAKQLIGIPWRVAFALQADGWYLRSEITWCKKAPMPESVTDRPTSATEKLFLFAKLPQYFYDADAVRLPAADPARLDFAHGAKMDDSRNDTDRMNFGGGNGANMRNYLLLGPAPYPGAHFATFPPALVEPCIKAGTSERGCCPKCGSPWERVVEKEGITKRQAMYQKGESSYFTANGNALNYKGGHTLPERTITTLGFAPSCFCRDLVPCPGDHTQGDCLMCDNTGFAPVIPEPVPCVVLDPFAGSCTTLQVARALGRHGIGLDLSFRYLSQEAKERLQITDYEEWANGQAIQAEDSEGNHPWFDRLYSVEK